MLVERNHHQIYYRVERMLKNGEGASDKVRNHAGLDAQQLAHSLNNMHMIQRIQSALGQTGADSHLREMYVYPQQRCGDEAVGLREVRNGARHLIELTCHEEEEDSKPYTKGNGLQRRRGVHLTPLVRTFTDKGVVGVSGRIPGTVHGSGLMDLSRVKSGDEVRGDANSDRMESGGEEGAKEEKLLDNVILNG